METSLIHYLWHCAKPFAGVLRPQALHTYVEHVTPLTFCTVSKYSAHAQAKKLILNSHDSVKL